MKLIAAIGDVHACSRELILLLDALEWLPLDEVWSLGDVVEVGPDNAGTVALLRARGVRLIQGNHEQMILSLKDKGVMPDKPEMARATKELAPADWDYIRSAPRMHHDPLLNAVLVHGGLWPSTPLEKQPKNVVRCQMVHPARKFKNESRWWGPSAASSRRGLTEEQSRAQGFERWYRLWDGSADVYYGHSVFAQPNMQRRAGAGLTCGVDTGVCFGGALTAAIIGGGEPHFVGVKSDKVYATMTERTLWEQ
jgi:hypothetical protein